jgi:hypothetical protein
MLLILEIAAGVVLGGLILGFWPYILLGLIHATKFLVGLLVLGFLGAIIYGVISDVISGGHQP